MGSRLRRAAAHERQVKESRRTFQLRNALPAQNAPPYFQKTSRRVGAAMKLRQRTIRFAARSCGYSRLILRYTRRINKWQRLLFEAKFRIQQVPRLLHTCFQ